MGLPAAVLQALVPCSPALAPPPKPKHTPPAPDVDRFTSGTVAVQPEPVVTELRGLAELHQAQQAQKAA